jgi:hypothetical protein
MKNLTIGQASSAIRNYEGPVQSDIGIISPKKSTHVTDMTIAQNSGTSLSRKIGRASMHDAFIIRSVHNIQ